MKRVLLIVIIFFNSLNVFSQEKKNESAKVLASSFDVNLLVSNKGVGYGGGITFYTTKMNSHRFVVNTSNGLKTRMGQRNKMKVISYLFSKAFLFDKLLVETGGGIGIMHLKTLDRNVITKTMYYGSNWFGGAYHEYAEVEKLKISVPLQFKFGYVSSKGLGTGVDLHFNIHSSGISTSVAYYISIGGLKSQNKKASK